MKDLEEKLVKFIREQVQQAGFQKVILGLSGGIDSALVAYLAVKALGKENVLTVKMPYKTSSKESIE
ncbi:NAD(+) synthase, partial [Fusobacterium necrophorum]